MSLSYLKLPFTEWGAMCNGKEAYTDLAPGMLSAAAYREERLHKRIAELEATPATPTDTSHIQDPADFDMEKIAALPDWEPAAPADAGVRVTIRNEALEDAACLVKAGCGYNWDQIADAIRALQSSPQAPKTEGDDE